MIPRRFAPDDSLVAHGRRIRRLPLRGGVMKRIYYLVPNLDLMRLIVDDLLLARVEDRQIDVQAKRGQLLLKVDVPGERVDEIHQLVQKRHPASAFGEPKESFWPFHEILLSD